MEINAMEYKFDVYISLLQWWHVEYELAFDS